MTYYFVSYALRRIDTGEWGLSECLIDRHPIEWLIDVRKGEEGAKTYFEYFLIGWEEVPEEIYKNFRFSIG